MKNINKINHKEVFFDLLKTTLEKHDIQSGRSFSDWGRTIDGTQDRLLKLLTREMMAVPE